MSEQRLLTVPTFEIMLEHHSVMRNVIREMDERGEPYVREAHFVARLHQYMQEQNTDKRKQLRTAFSTENLLASHILVDKDEFGGESRLIFDRSVIGVFRLFDRSLFQDLTDVALKTQLSTLRLLLGRLKSESLLFSDADLDYKELIDELFHRLSELFNSIRLNLVKMQSINQELSQASELAAKADNPAIFSSLQRDSIEKISHLLSRHILPTRQFLDEKSRLKDGPNLFECLQNLRHLFSFNQDHERALAMLRYELSFNSFHAQISKVSKSVDQFLARSKKRLKQFNAIESAFAQLMNELDATRENLKRSQIDGQFARDNGTFLGLMQQPRPKVLRISSSQAYMHNVVSDIEARLTDQQLFQQRGSSQLTSSRDDSTEKRLNRSHQVYQLVKQMKMAEYQDLTLSLHRRLIANLEDYHFIDLLEGLNFLVKSDAILDGHQVKITNFQARLKHQQTVYLYRKIRTERETS
ncbi:hypothetical protein BOO92_03525 [Vibrio navarrensis]|uniref:hypothetical protein n=1 Tax=Vibrio navarrensis TaxID=29495 RepID=UPI0018660108|nr:hypothetical protein [Vibrio navarrensis]MBE3655775.1 hypothetical protein [Vibrio navarrensis]